MTEMTESKATYIKTLRLPLDRNIFALDDDGNPVALPDDKAKAVRAALVNGSKEYARVFNVTSSTLYAKRLANLPEKIWEAIPETYTPLKRKKIISGVLSGATLSTARAQAKAQFVGKNRYDMLERGSRTLATAKMDGTFPIPIRAAELKIIKFKKHYYLGGQIFSVTFAKSESIPNWIYFKIVPKDRDKYLWAELDKIHSGKYEVRDGKIVRQFKRRKPTITARIAVKCEIDPNLKLSEDNILGIDLGRTVPIALHVRRGGRPEEWAMTIGRRWEITKIRRKIKYRLRKTKSLIAGSSSITKGNLKESLARELKKLRNAESEFVDSVCGRLANIVAQTGRRYGCGIWQLEDLLNRGSGEKNDGADGQEPEIDIDEPDDHDASRSARLMGSDWPLAKLIDAIILKANSIGAKIVFVDPKYTSQRCSSCGYISPGNRPSRDLFRCQKCDTIDHADKNAARNLSIKGIDMIISEEIKRKIALTPTHRIIKKCSLPSKGRRLYAGGPCLGPATTVEPAPEAHRRSEAPDGGQGLSRIPEGNIDGEGAASNKNRLMADAAQPKCANLKRACDHSEDRGGDISNQDCDLRK